MKYRIIALLALVMITIFAYKESKLVDLDEEAYKAWAAVYIANKGDTEIIEGITSQLETRDNKVIANTALRAAEKIKNPRSKKYDDLAYSKDIYRIILLNNELDNANTLFFPAYESRIDFLKSKTEKTKLYARLAKLYYDNGDSENYNRLITKAFDTSLALPALTSRESLAFALDIIVKLDDKENFFKYAPQTPDGFYKRFLLLSMIQQANIMKELRLKEKDSDYKKQAKYDFAPMREFERSGNNISRLNEETYDRAMKIVLYFALYYKLPWSVKKWSYGNIPFFAYNGYLRGNESMYSYFKNKAISKEQLFDMRAGYKNYVEYTSLALLLMGDTKDAVDLIKTIPEKDKRYNVLRKNLKHIIKNDDGFEILKKSGLL